MSAATGATGGFEEKRALLARLLAGGVRGGVRAAPLSFAQQRLWFLDQLHPGSDAYNISQALRLRGELDEAALRRALAAVTARHETLRTTLRAVGDRPVQLVRPATGGPLAVVDLAALPAARREVEARRLATAEAARPFDLARGPLWRVVVLRLDARERGVLFTMHHVISDGWSMQVLGREVAALYAAERDGGEAALPELAIQYADFAVWQRRRLGTQAGEGPRAFWRQRLGGCPERLELPTDRPRPAVQSHHGAVQEVELAPELHAAGLRLARELAATPLVPYLAGLAVLLGDWSDSRELVLGLPSGGRERPELEPLIGFFINMLPVRVDLAAPGSFRELAAQVRGSALAALSHQEVPFDVIVEDLALRRGLAHDPLVQVSVDLRTAPAQEPPRFPGLEPLPLLPAGDGPHLERAHFDLAFDVVALPRHPAVRVTYRTELWEHATITRRLASLPPLLAAAFERPEVPLAELFALLAQQRRQVRGEAARAAQSRRSEKLGGLKRRAATGGGR